MPRREAAHQQTDMQVLKQQLRDAKQFSGLMLLHYSLSVNAWKCKQMISIPMMKVTGCRPPGLIKQQLHINIDLKLVPAFFFQN